MYYFRPLFKLFSTTPLDHSFNKNKLNNCIDLRKERFLSLESIFFTEKNEDHLKFSHFNSSRKLFET